MNPEIAIGQRPASILIVDDVAANLQVLTGMLDDRGYLTRPVTSGKMALLAAQNDPPDLVLLDITMPEMDGYEVCAHMKASEKLKDIPVIFISALHETLDKVKGFSVGGLDYVTKPFQFEEVHARVETHLKLRRLQLQLEEQKQELSRSNQDLQQFAYVASHDMQEPLRMIKSFLQLLEQQYRGKLDAKADEYIHYAVDGADRMSRLISDLLAYARVGTQGEAFKEWDCNMVLRQVLENLQTLIRESGAVVDSEPLPTVMGDLTQLTQLFQNLVGNAMKFRDERSPVVHVGARQLDKEWEFSIRDNGIGIDPGQSDRLFMMFQRLHDHSKYPGTGIGLATCRKIVERHGGRIWVQSRPGEGSTFFFTIRREPS
jgi:signal transduction histidine kinase